MKYLLSILILFSGFSFGSKIYMICDTEYFFYPELGERQLLVLDFDKSEVRKSYFLSESLLVFGMDIFEDLQYGSLNYRWGEFKYNLNRQTGMLFQDYNEKSYEHECKKVTEKEFRKAEKELTDINNKALEDRKF